MLESIGITKSMIGDLVINIANIVILFLVTKKLLYKPLRKFLDARSEKIEKAQSDAEIATAAANASKAEYDELITNAEQEKNAMLAEAKKKADADAAAVLSDAQNKAGDILAKADADAARRRDKASEEAKEDIADAAVAIAEKILSREVNDDDNKKIIEDYFG